MSQTGIQRVRDLDRRPLHVCQHTLAVHRVSARSAHGRSPRRTRMALVIRTARRLAVFGDMLGQVGVFSTQHFEVTPMPRTTPHVPADAFTSDFVDFYGRRRQSNLTFLPSWCSESSSNNTSKRSHGRTSALVKVAFEDMAPASHRGLTGPAGNRPDPGLAFTRICKYSRRWPSPHDRSRDTS